MKVHCGSRLDCYNKNPLAAMTCKYAKGHEGSTMTVHSCQYLDRGKWTDVFMVPDPVTVPAKPGEEG
jgi:hypothetical protein